MPAPTYASLEERFWAKVNIGSDDECWEWHAGVARGGYGAFAIRRGHLIPAHRFAWTATHGGIPDGLWVLHHCDNPPCVNPAHLYVGTRADNIADMVRRRRHWAHQGKNYSIGELNGRAKLTAAKVREIRERRAAGERSSALAREFGVTHSQLNSIIRHEAWASVT